MRRVVLDARAIIASSERLDSVAIQTLVQNARRFDIEVCIPEVVLQEVINKHRESTEEAANKLTEAVRAVSHLLDPGVSYEISEEQLSDERIKHEQRLRRLRRLNRLHSFENFISAGMHGASSC